MTSYIIISFLMMVTPGPGVLSLAGVGAGFGWRVGIMYLIGLFLGTNGVALLVVLGFKQFLFEIDGVELTFLVLSLSYLSFLSWRIATSDNKTGFKETSKAPKLYEGVFLQFVNPKAYVVQGHLFVVLSLGISSYNTEIFTKFLIVNSIWIPIHILWLWLGISLKKWSLASNKQVWVNRGMGLALFAVVILSAIMELNTDI
ncbi:MAG: LysE family transporter [Alphaproteobacteria bacterium]|nr:LysE family transporter [Alphaproteobacteria bacterium]MDG1882713.1 LysE family transporter [Alphaproteobacteria bacterium]MDG2457816.1 LysE family transporter [Alphaproteobacteria bacterium]|tara:strand:+ start:132 stop:734 length:603 start_codon:yes stop_codon:yes gene_type:complete